MTERQNAHTETENTPPGELNMFSKLGFLCKGGKYPQHECVVVAGRLFVAVALWLLLFAPTVARDDGGRETRYEICVVSGVVKSDSLR